MREATLKPVEYEFTLPDGSKRYEFVDPESGYSVMAQIRMFSDMHGAIRAAPVQSTLFELQDDDRPVSQRSVASPF